MTSSQTQEPDDKATRRRLRNGLISLAILVIIVVGLLASVSGLKTVAHAIVHMSPVWLAVALGLEVLSCASYALAFLQVFSRAPLRFGARVALAELAFGAAVPVGGAGSVAVGAWLMVERGRDLKTVSERSAALFLITSAINVFTLIAAGAALFFGVIPGPRNPLLGALPAAVGVVVLAFFLALPKLTARAAAARSQGKLRTLLDSTTQSVDLTRGILFHADWRIVGAVGYLWFDISVLAACFAGIGHVPPLAAIVLAYQIAYLSAVIPVPGGIGVVDGSFVGVLVLYGVDARSAAAATLVYRGISLWIPAIWGTVAYIVLRRTRDRPLRPRSGETQDGPVTTDTEGNKEARNDG